MQMIHMAKSYLHNELDAEDVVHEVFLCIATKHIKFIQELYNPEDVRNYLLKATMNTALNKLKRKDHNHMSLEDISEENLDDMPDLVTDSFIDLLCTKAEYDSVCVRCSFLLL